MSSIYNAVRSSKVTTGNASMFSSMRTFDSDAQVCPTRSNVSDFGVVGVSRDSIQTYTAGCYSAMDRMQVENLQRPRYSSFLNASAISMPGIGDSDLPKAVPEYSMTKPYYDTQLGYQYTRPVLSQSQMTPAYALSSVISTLGNNAQELDSAKVSCFMDRNYNNTNCQTNS